MLGPKSTPESDAATTDARTGWAPSAHERGVEGFYRTGAARYGEWHGGYLNFGLWEPGISDYLAAAENLVRRHAEMVGLGRRSRLLDVACGMGAQDLFLLRAFQPRTIDGLDVTRSHVEHARRRARDAGLEARLRFRHGTATAVPFPDGTFTSVCCIEGAQHFDTRAAFFRESFRVLAPGGAIATSDFAMSRRPATWIERIVFETSRRAWHVPRANVVSIEGYCAELERAGFRDVEVRPVGAQTIPGYYFEQMRAEIARATDQIRGRLWGRLSRIADRLLLEAFRRGVIEYVLARGVKPRRDRRRAWPRVVAP